jgi:hypothetical protein
MQTVTMSTETRPGPAALTGESRSCMTCLSRFDVSLLRSTGPGLWCCLDTAGCWQRQDAGGPQREFADASPAPGTSRGEIAAFENSERVA